MSKKSNDINDNSEPLVPPGEDQYLLGSLDAERLENVKLGLAKSYFDSIPKIYLHPEYIRGFNKFLEENTLIEIEKIQ